jgi:glycosyltransferase involved in cell wall biosynthesis
MKILYASCRYDALDPDAGSGVDFNLFQTFKEHGAELQIAGPYPDVPSPGERIYRKVHRLISRKMTAKFSEAYLHACAVEVEKAADKFQPEVIFTHNLIPLVYINTKVPIIHKSDAFLKNMHEQWPTYSKLEFLRMLAWEKKALEKCALVITASHWAAQPVLDHYRVPSSRVLILPNPSSLPDAIIPNGIEKKILQREEVHLLAVAKNYDLKGVDIAIQVTQMLRKQGIPANLRVAGQNGRNVDGVEFMGIYKKSDPEQLAAYVSQYQWAHLLIHPARYDSSPIVCSEAAAFGVPTLTNAVGGLATSVQDGVSGVVLAKGSPAMLYVEAIKKFINEPELYAHLRKTTRQRYENELNWKAAGGHILAGMQRVLQMQERNLNGR